MKGRNTNNTSVGTMDFAIAGALGIGTALIYGLVAGDTKSTLDMDRPADGKSSEGNPNPKLKPKPNLLKRIVSFIKPVGKPAIIYRVNEMPLTIGMQGRLVANMQLSLNKIEGKKVVADGKFGPKTAAQLAKLGYPHSVIQANVLAAIRQRAYPDVNKQGATETVSNYLTRRGFSQTSINVAISIKKALNSFKSDYERDKYLNDVLRNIEDKKISQILRAYSAMNRVKLTDQMAQFKIASSIIRPRLLPLE